MPTSNNEDAVAIQDDPKVEVKKKKQFNYRDTEAQDH